MRKRQQERDRCNNRLTPRMQRIGLDIAALNMQVVQKQAVVDMKRGEDEQYLQKLTLKEKLVTQAESVIQDKKREVHKDCVNFSLDQLAKEKRREWHLSDPRQLKTDRPGRIEGGSQGMSSMQHFQGEKGSDPEVLKENRQNHVSWLMAQMAEKNLRAEVAKDEDRCDDDALVKANDLRGMCEQAEAQERKAEMYAIARENEQMAVCHSARKIAAKEREDLATEQHKINTIRQNSARELYDYDIGSNGRKRDYKRCSYEEEVKLWEINKAMAQAKLDRKDVDAHLDDGYHKIGCAVDWLGTSTDDAYARKNTQRRIALDEVNKVTAKENWALKIQEAKEYLSFAPSP